MGLSDSRLGRILGLGPGGNRLSTTLDLSGHVVASKNTSGQDIRPYVGWCSNGMWSPRPIRNYGH